MPCVCLSRKKKDKPLCAPLQTSKLNTLPTYLDPSSPGLKFGSLTLLNRIERILNPSKSEKVILLIPNLPTNTFVWFVISQSGAPALEIHLPPPIRPESIINLSFRPSLSQKPKLINNDQNLSPPKVPLEPLPTHPHPVELGPENVQTTHQTLTSVIPSGRTRPCSLIIPHDRHSQYAVVLNSSHPLQPPISPEPTPTINQSFQSSIQQVSSPPAILPSSNSLPPHVHVLRPRFNPPMTPPLTPPPSVPLPPLPVASAYPNHLPPPMFKGKQRNLHPDRMYSYHPSINPPSMGNRQRSQSSPLSSQIAPSPPRLQVISSRQLRSLSSPDSYISDSENSDCTNPTSEHCASDDLPIALFESSYSPPPPIPVIQDFSKQFLHPTIRFL